MKRFWAVIGIVLSAGTLVYAQGTPQDKIYSRQRAFRFPFQILDPAEQKQLQEVQLYVARNGGKWEKYAAVAPDLPPEKRSFSFRTDEDGEFWFAVRTMDKKGGLSPADDSELQVGLRVVVDSEVPKIDLRPITRPGSDVGIEWEVHDRNIDLDTLKIEYRVEGAGEGWQAVPGVLPKFVGQAIWTPESAGRVTVRCQVQDRSQNFGIQTIELETASEPRGELPTVSQPAAPRGAQRSLIGQETESSAALRPIQTAPELPVNRPSAFERVPSAATKRAVPPDPAYEPPSRPPAHMPVEPEADSTAAAPFRGSPAMTASKPTNRQIVADSEVSLDYEIEDEGPSGISTIELWVTHDMGRTWRRIGEDTDRQSPFVVNLAGEGIFGLTMVARSGVGLGDRPPSSGDQPQMWVEVDKMPPQIQLDAPEIAKGAQAGNVLINWHAQDANLGERCVSLFYAEAGRNDWKPIATGIENTGRYVWKLGPQVPFRFRIAIEVCDLAGNREMAESAEVTIDMSRPKPKISGVNAGRNYR